ncbi:MAG: hypothetical protein NT077_01745 [Candidatus Taylorbacteria bacterium]|nr:hypothetical protein [Candidatus Taylorbacteria bacterium]
MDEPENVNKTTRLVWIFFILTILVAVGYYFYFYKPVIETGDFVYVNKSFSRAEVTAALKKLTASSTKSIIPLQDEQAALKKLSEPAKSTK